MKSESTKYLESPSLLPDVTTKAGADLKLAKDIADIRIANMTKQTREDLGFTEVLLATMDELNAGLEEKLIEELESIKHKDSKRAAPRVLPLYDAECFKAIIKKLKVRIEKGVHKKSPFTSEDWDAARDYKKNLFLNTFTKCIQPLIATDEKDSGPEDGATAATEFTIVLPFELLKASSLDMHRVMKTMNNIIGYNGDGMKIVKIIQAMVNEKIVEVRKLTYHGRSIYDRFEMNGVLIATAVKE